MSGSQDHTEWDTPPAPDDLWAYRARPDTQSRYLYGVVDGDTYDVIIDCGFGITKRERVRPHHINTAEIFGRTDDYEAGVEHRNFVRDWMKEHVGDPIDHVRLGTWPLRIRTYNQSGKFGRLLADIYTEDGDSLTNALLDEFGDAIREEY